MTTIQFETGQKVKFDGTPTQQDIEEVATKLGLNKKPDVQPKSSFLSSSGPSFPANEGGVSGILPNLAKTIGNIPSSARDLAKSVIAPVNPFDTQSPINIGSNIAQGASAVADLYKQNGILGGLKALGQGVGGVIKKGVDAYTGMGDKIYSTLEKNVVDQNSVSKGVATATANAVSDVAKVGIENPLLIPSLIYGGEETLGGKKDIISKIASPVTREADTGLLSTASRLTSKSESQIESAVVKKFEKGVKPLLPGKTTPTKLAQYRDDVVSAIKTINENKPNLSFTSDLGEVVTGQNPQSLQELTHAIEQTKKTIFTKYDTLAKQAGDAGVSVNMSPIASELDSVISNKALSITNPKAIQYAQELKDRLSKVGNLDAMTSQEVIQNYNKSLEAFYRNPSYDTASQAAIDAMVANRMRQSLDEGISSLTGEQYGALKKQYGSLKSVEKDVIKASLRDARKNTKGLLDYADIFSGGQIVNGILSLNPATILQGVTQKGISSYFKYLNNPNRAIQKMFRVVEENPRFQPFMTPSNSSNTVPPQITNANASVQTTPRIINTTGFSETNAPITRSKQINPSMGNNINIPQKLPLLQKKASTISTPILSKENQIPRMTSYADAVKVGKILAQETNPDRIALILKSFRTLPDEVIPELAQKISVESDPKVIHTLINSYPEKSTRNPFLKFLRGFDGEASQ